MPTTCLQYHNYGRNGLPLPHDPEEYFGNADGGITTRLKFVTEELGSTCYLIVGIGRKPPTFYLWECFTITDVEDDGDGNFYASGPGWMLNPPQKLEGSDFDEFRRQCANFAAFKRIGHLPYTDTLQQLATTCHRSQIDERTVQFCRELVGPDPR